MFNSYVALAKFSIVLYFNKLILTFIFVALCAYREYVVAWQWDYVVCTWVCVCVCLRANSSMKIFTWPTQSFPFKFYFILIVIIFSVRTNFFLFFYALYIIRFLVQSLALCYLNINCYTLTYQTVVSCVSLWLYSLDEKNKIYFNALVCWF